VAVDSEKIGDTLRATPFPQLRLSINLEKNDWAIFGRFFLTHLSSCPRNRFTKEILANEKEKPLPFPEICCSPEKNFETHFVSDEMLEDVPYHQVPILPNTILQVLHFCKIFSKICVFFKYNNVQNNNHFITFSFS
jgi:hypothetical protein